MTAVLSNTATAGVKMPRNGPVAKSPAALRLNSRRQWINRIVVGLCSFATLLGLAALALILFTLLKNGLAGLSLTVFTHDEGAPGSHGGLRNAIVGTLIQTALGTLIGTPLGLLVGTYLAEYGRGSVLSSAVRFVSDILLSAPSILVGLFMYQLIVRPTGAFSGIAGCLALAVLVIPIVVRSTEDMLRLLPAQLREAAVALGAPRWRVITFICYRAAIDGIATGVLLAISRIAGETAPLLFTSLGNPNLSVNLAEPMGSLPVTIYKFAGSAYSDWQLLSWAGALLITLGVLGLNILARAILGRRQ
ncbi:Phosphate transport system permease protein pstA [Granulibacter bethesdensis CGDNIH1]|uniref:Phosphate transport system permease protein PstA n=2 Tax=Granulibacter bethesdensis TaxID=364410 RepID=Q0BTP2_GRABC|nr:Phosphate transport system permease protein pstA [Granulibacter bethesdensis CGDNIH1]APH51621.1 Phosphate transport system permease protein pstA [Granulibacter bethesdensis]APH64314.1 Phosphate transport system permease protein pstA [Granulibacter bethesdensis]